jgi:3-hydroxy-9,10-secoandrosta-1,3,5(10)-triene-9,17-dione monooxygenase reductase component
VRTPPAGARRPIPADRRDARSLGGIDSPGFASAANGIEEARFRQVLGHFATGVTVVTCMSSGRPLGLSVNSFTSVSLDPPLVAFCVSRRSSTWPLLRESGMFCVNVLAEDQEALSRTFAAPGRERFLGIGWRPAPSGAPVLAGVLAWVDCTVEAEYDAGDHLIVVGRVQELDLLQEGRPLVFYRGGYGRFEP